MAVLQYVMGQLPLRQPYHALNNYDSEIEIAYLQPPIVIDLRFNGAHNAPYIPQDTAGQTWLSERLQYLNYFSDLTDSDLASQPHYRDVRLLTAHEIAYFKQMNQTAHNATVFIHGFNIPYGAFGRQFRAFTNDGQRQAAVSSAQQVLYTGLPETASAMPYWVTSTGGDPAMVWRDEQHVQQAFHKHLTSPIPHDLNGNGCHNWWLSVEYQMNIAAGFTGFSYEFDATQAGYTRMIHLAWLAAPKNSADYYAVLPIAEITAYGVAEVLAQLIAEGITVNIIAHSAGNIVLIKALQLLAQHPNYHNAIANIYLCQAAIPNYAISPHANQLDKSLDHYWQTSDAHKAVRRIHVLSSHRDTVLGPRVNNSAQQSAMEEGAFTLVPLVIARIDRLLQHHGSDQLFMSVYNIAMLFSVPVTALLYSHASREHCYQRLRQNPQTDATAILHPTLTQQVDYLQKHHGKQLQHLQCDGLKCLLALDYVVLTSLSDNRIYRSMQYAGYSIHDSFKRQFAKLRKLVLQKDDAAKQLHAKSALHAMLQQSQCADNCITWLKEFDDIAQAVPAPQDHRIAGYRELVHSICEKTRHMIDFTWASYHQTIMHLHTNPLSPLTSSQHDSAAIEIAALVWSVLACRGIQPAPALGYSGPDRQDVAIQQLMATGRLNHVDQTDYVYAHSAMKHPTIELTNKLFGKTIFKTMGVFGKWHA